MPTKEQREWLKHLGATGAVTATAPEKPEETPGTEAKESPKVGTPPPFGIVASVGRGGKNQKDDVIATQAELNRKLKLSLELDGKCGPATINAIIAYQKSIGFKMTDGLIEVGGKTATALAGGRAGSAKDETTPEAPSTGGSKGAKPGGGAKPSASKAGGESETGEGETGEYVGGMLSGTKGPLNKMTESLLKKNEQMQTNKSAEGAMEAARSSAQGSGNTLNNKLQVTPNPAGQKCFNEGWKFWDAGEVARANSNAMAPLIDGISLAARISLMLGATEFYQKAKVKFSEGLQYL